MCEYCENSGNVRPIIYIDPFLAVIRESRIVVDYSKGRSHKRVVRDINFCPMCGRDLREEDHV